MFQRFKNSLSNPKYVFFYIKDKFSKVLLYILILTILLSLPMFLIAGTNKELLFPSASEVSKGFEDNFIPHNITIVDGKLLLVEEKISYNFSVENYTFLIGIVPKDAQSFIISFEKNEIVLYSNLNSMNLLPIQIIPYEEGSYPITLEMLNDVTNILIYENTLMFSMIVVGAFFNNLRLVVIYGLLLALLAKVLNNIPLNFSANFKIAIYLLTPWAVFTTLTTLFNLQYLSFLGLAISYGYQIYAYRSVKIFTSIGGDKK